MPDYGRIMKDEIVVGGMLVLLTFVCMTIYTVVALAQPFDARAFGESAGIILGAIGGGQGVRDWLAGKGEADANARHD
jgi:hypothetical protein